TTFSGSSPSSTSSTSPRITARPAPSSYSSSLAQAVRCRWRTWLRPSTRTTSRPSTRWTKSRASSSKMSMMIWSPPARGSVPAFPAPVSPPACPWPIAVMQNTSARAPARRRTLRHPSFIEPSPPRDSRALGCGSPFPWLAAARHDQHLTLAVAFEAVLLEPVDDFGDVASPAVRPLDAPAPPQADHFLFELRLHGRRPDDVAVHGEHDRPRRHDFLLRRPPFELVAVEMDAVFVHEHHVAYEHQVVGLPVPASRLRRKGDKRVPVPVENAVLDGVDPYPFALIGDGARVQLKLTVALPPADHPRGNQLRPGLFGRGRLGRRRLLLPVQSPP